jgi:hypothetical protein
MHRSLLSRFLSDMQQAALPIEDRVEITLNRARGARDQVNAEIARLDAAERAQDIGHAVRSADPDGGRVLPFPVRSPSAESGAVAAPGGKG